MTSLMKGGLAAACVLWAASTSADDRIEIKGYYREDGVYVAQRVIDPLDLPAPARVAPPADLAERRRWIEGLFAGRVVKAKVSFPACRGGVVLRTDDPGQGNVDLFKKVGKYGVAIEKDAAALITDFRVTDNALDVDLSGGGFGTAGDVAKRVLKGICTLGWTEVRGYQHIRYQRGSRLRILSPKPWAPEDLTLEKVSAALAPALES